MKQLVVLSVAKGNGNKLNPSNIRNRFYRILKGAGIETKGIHSLRHTFATNLVNGVRLNDGTIRAL
ncbi:tyrosine-type recombinase/integrase [uncultured Eubacterium sp.]|uniref:tyrosine-type recombinase/integrase n=1 Tax=uncultured Eubacterium sp. TaxID=165185 RepID=UPI0025E33B35|nr:tyrosine-type recombinase/integrase [uncultured Eubacterium sp.]